MRQWQSYLALERPGRLFPHETRMLLSSVGSAGSQRFSVNRISVIGFGTEVKIRGAQLFGLAKEQVSAGFEVEVQALHEGNALRTRKVRQHVHAEDAVEASDINRLGQVHGIESDQAAESRL